MNARSKMLWGILHAGLCAILLISVVYAATTTIDTNDGSVDPNWSAVTMLRDDPDNDSATPSDAELDKVWIANNSALDTFYFRADNLFQLPATELIAAKLDCNRNGSYTDPVDVVVLIDLYLDTSFECQGDTYNGSCYHDAPEDNNGSTAAEEINAGGGIYTYEWMGSTAGTVDWSSCLGTIAVQFAAVYHSDYTLEDDTTVVRDYNSPTAVQLEHMTATAGDRWFPTSLPLISAILLGSLWFLRRRKPQLQNNEGKGIQISRGH